MIRMRHSGHCKFGVSVSARVADSWNNLKAHTEGLKIDLESEGF